MSTENKPSSRAGSKTNLNESSWPLLQEAVEHGVVMQNPDIDIKITTDPGSAETFEMKEKDENEVPNGKEKKKKEKKDKNKGTAERGVCKFDEMTCGLNLNDRDECGINKHVNIAFGDVIAEPDATHGPDAPWKMAYAAFTFVKSGIYGALAAVLGVPLAILWGFIFALLSFVFIWIITPLLRIFALFFAVVRNLFEMVTRTFIEPLFASIGALMSQIRIKRDVTTTYQKAQQTNTEEEV
ncbi:unnamed protein product [Notodromas monacha]|uniref:Caveolin n=1 Tax=Notodromas monacha TaxID=399045 RepID=A0A7R9BVW5_9CRUS|nr:unnamed protein product [Notodromas monacha]CAG0921374.1 unnamed protein product [Notodromas monacha]